jgi:outer membrane protein
MKTRRHLFVWQFILISLIAFMDLKSQPLPEKITIGIISDYESADIYFAPMIINETLRLAGSRYNIEFPEDKVVSGDFNFTKLKKYVNDFMEDDELDIIVGIGGLVSEILSKSGPFAKPVLANGVFHPGLQSIPLTPDNTSGVKNFGYTLVSLSMERDLESFHSIFPFKNLGLLMYEEYLNSIPGIDDYFFSFIDKYDARAQIIPVGKDYTEALENLPTDLDAIYVGLLYDYSLSELQDFINQLNTKKLPSFALIGRPYVELGILAGAAPGNNLENLSRRVALDIEKILDGEDPANFSVTVDYKDELVVNMKTAREIDFFPTFNTLAQAEVLYEEGLEGARRISYPGVIAELLENNLHLKIAGQEVLSGSKEINKARSAYLPQVNLSASQILIDKTRAEASFGMNAQKTTFGTGMLSQVIYSEPAIANIRIQKILQERRNYEFTQREFDKILQVSLAYLNLLKAQTYEKILKENLNLTRKHLDIARLRQEVGFSGVSDVYRWESEIARLNIEVVNARAQRRAAGFALNQILNRPLDEKFIAEDLAADDEFITGKGGLESTISNARTWRYFKDFMTNEALERSPEIKQLDQYIAVQERLLKMNLRGRYLPTFGIQTQGDYFISRRGAGTEPMDPIEIPGMDPIAIGTTPKSTQWNLGISASIPIFQGGYKEAEIRQSKIDLDILADQRSDLVNKIIQRSLTRFEFIGASSPAMDMASQAAEAANLSLRLSQDAYSKGQISIVDLIDVQTAAVQSNLLKANSVYDFLIDYLELSRATGIFLFLLTPDEKTDLTQRLLQYMVSKAPYELIR